MSLPIDIRYRKAYFSLTPDKQKDVRQARTHAVTNAWRILWNRFEKTVAKKTGRLRKQIFEMIQSQMALLTNNKLTIAFQYLAAPISPEGESYAQYHIVGPDGVAITDRPYVNPTTAGTRPLNEFRFMDMFEDLITQNMFEEFKLISRKNWKPKWRQYVRVL